MYCGHIGARCLEVSLIGSIEQSHILIEHADVLLFEHLTVLAEHLIAVLVILTILCDLVNKEKRQSLDAHVKEFFFLLKVREDGFSYLNTAHITLGDVADDLSGFQCFTVGEGDRVPDRIDLRNGIATILFHLLRNIE